ncbi:MAG: hypothetical protein Q9208_005177 [Pyrenodesmia sp. 3 TL-2023]
MTKQKIEAYNKLVAAAEQAPNTEKRERITKFADEVRGTKQTGAAFDKKYERLMRKTQTMTKEKEERGDGKTFSSRTHHWDVRNKKGTDCTSCDEVDASNARREREREANGKKQSKADRLTAWLTRSGKDRKERHKKAGLESSEGHGALEGPMGAVHL